MIIVKQPKATYKRSKQQENKTSSIRKNCVEMFD